MSRFILLDDAEGVRTITLNRPEVLNACNASLIESLGQAVHDAADDPVVRCLVITGAGRAFCSGQDLAEYAELYASDAPIDPGPRLRDDYNPIIRAIRKMEKPVVGSINGVAAGAGCSLALACDLRIAAESASLSQAFVHVGLVPDCGSTFLLPRLVGLARATELAWTGRSVSAREALAIGLVNRVVGEADLPAETMTLARELARGPTRALGLAKRALNAAGTADLETQLELETQLQEAATQTADHREGARAFFEKRRPRFTGR